jgi:hypothetical protein
MLPVCSLQSLFLSAVRLQSRIKVHRKKVLLSYKYIQLVAHEDQSDNNQDHPGGHIDIF